METGYKCCICGKEKTGYGNSCWPLYPDDSEHRCCDNCNRYVVVPTRRAEVDTERQYQATHRTEFKS